MDVSPSSPVPIGYIVLFIVFLFCSAYFAGAETSLSSVSRIRMIRFADDGSKRAKRVLMILDNYDSAISTILVCNNIFHIGSASIATLFAARMWGSGAVAWTTVVTTLIVFFIAEMIPKAFAKACNERFALIISGSLSLIMKIMKPIVFVFTSMGNGVKKLFRMGGDVEDPTVTEEELHDIINTISKEGAIDEETSELVQSALEFTDTPVRDVFTPWKDVLCVKSDMQPKEIAGLIDGCNHSRLPVVDASDEVVGMLQIRKYLKAYIERHGHVSLSRIMDKALFVIQGAPIDELLTNMSAGKTHIAIVRDDNGKNLGIITIEDILEELVGEIYDEDDVALEEGGEKA
ncbi:MAG TPA: hemolysin family protein [Clostridia bacterium]|nr:hemolysin family protein [Clostridia bacterium]